jgi:hypothetical protein
MGKKIRGLESISLFLTILLIFITSSLTIALTSNFGNLVHDGSITVTNSGLSGSFSQAMLALQCCVIIFAGLYVLLHLIRRRIETKQEVEQTEPLFSKHILWFSFVKWIIYLTLAAGITSSAMNIHLLENFSQISGVTINPNPIPAQGNATLHGSYATVNFSVSIATLILSLLCMILRKEFITIFGFLNQIMLNTVLIL